MTSCDRILAAVLITLHTGSPWQTWLTDYDSPGESAQAHGIGSNCQLGSQPVQKSHHFSVE